LNRQLLSVNVSIRNKKELFLRKGAKAFLIKNPLSSQEDLARELDLPRSTLSRKISEYQLRLR